MVWSIDAWAFFNLAIWLTSDLESLLLKLNLNFSTLTFDENTLFGRDLLSSSIP
jgi:hypothetical protein